MKKMIWGLVLGLVLVPAIVSGVHADEAKDAATLQKQEAKRRKELKDTEWKVTMYSQKPTDKDAETGILVFTGETLSFSNFKSVNLEPIGYTLTAYKDNDRGTIETFKAVKDGNISMRADWEGQTMNGVISEMSSDGKKAKVHRFTSVNQVSAYVKPEVTKASEASAPVEEAAPKAMVSGEKSKTR